MLVGTWRKGGRVGGGDSARETGCLPGLSCPDAYHVLQALSLY